MNEKIDFFVNMADALRQVMQLPKTGNQGFAAGIHINRAREAINRFDKLLENLDKELNPETNKVMFDDAAKLKIATAMKAASLTYRYENNEAEPESMDEFVSMASAAIVAMLMMGIEFTKHDA